MVVPSSYAICTIPQSLMRVCYPTLRQPARRYPSCALRIAESPSLSRTLTLIIIQSAVKLLSADSAKLIAAFRTGKIGTIANKDCSLSWTSTRNSSIPCPLAQISCGLRSFSSRRRRETLKIGSWMTRPAHLINLIHLWYQRSMKARMN